ncbi:MAG: hypothetical protein RR705_00250 [Lachnospiraceae bacterium]
MNCADFYKNQLITSKYTKNRVVNRRNVTIDTCECREYYQNIEIRKNDLPIEKSVLTNEKEEIK